MSAPRLVLLAGLVLAPALLAGCLGGPTDGDGNYVAIVQNRTPGEIDSRVRVAHSATNVLPTSADPSVEAELTIAANRTGAFFFEFPPDARSVLLEVGRYRRLFTPVQLVECPVVVFEIAPARDTYLGCGPHLAEGEP